MHISRPFRQGTGVGIRLTLNRNIHDNGRAALADPNAHKALDEAVATAYGWGDGWRAGTLTDDEILARLFRLNQDRAAKQSEGGKT